LKDKNCVDLFYIKQQSLALIETNYLHDNYNKSVYNGINHQLFDKIKDFNFTYNYHYYSIKKTNFYKQGFDK